jgi:hypothetical protein
MWRYTQRSICILREYTVSDFRVQEKSTVSGEPQVFTSYKAVTFTLVMVTTLRLTQVCVCKHSRTALVWVPAESQVHSPFRVSSHIIVTYRGSWFPLEQDNQPIKKFPAPNSPFSYVLRSILILSACDYSGKMSHKFSTNMEYNKRL